MKIYILCFIFIHLVFLAPTQANANSISSKATIDKKSDPDKKSVTSTKVIKKSSAKVSRKKNKSNNLVVNKTLPSKNISKEEVANKKIVQIKFKSREPAQERVNIKAPSTTEEKKVVPIEFSNSMDEAELEPLDNSANKVFLQSQNQKTNTEAEVRKKLKKENKKRGKGIVDNQEVVYIKESDETEIPPVKDSQSAPESTTDNPTSLAVYANSTNPEDVGNGVSEIDETIAKVEKKDNTAMVGRAVDTAIGDLKKESDLEMLDYE